MDRFKRMFCGNQSTQGVYAVLLSTVFFISLLCSWIVPHFGGADERLHLDYAWQLSHGKFPDFYEGAKIPLYRHPPAVQFVAHHPPLYYAIQAPLVRYFVDVKRGLTSASMAARVVTIGIGLCCVAALVWLGGVIGGGSMLYRIGVPAIFCGFLPFVKVTSLIFNDSLALLFAILGIGIAWQIVHEGPSRALVLWLAVVSALGMAARATHASVVLVGCLSVVLHYCFVARLPLWKAVRSSLVPVSTVLVVVGISIGWFYLRNYTLSGSWTRVAPQSWAIVMNREHKDIGRVLSEVSMWLFPLLEPYGKLPQSLRWYLIAPAVGGLLLLCLTTVFRMRGSYTASHMLGGAMLGIVVILSYLQQIVHATGYGAFNPRYLMLVYLVLAVCMVRALRELSPWISTLMIGGFASLGLVGAAVWSASETPIQQDSSLTVFERVAHEICLVKGVPVGVVIGCCVGALGGTILQVLMWSREACRVGQSRLEDSTNA